MSNTPTPYAVYCIYFNVIFVLFLYIIIMLLIFVFKYFIIFVFISYPYLPWLLYNTDIVFSFYSAFLFSLF